MAFERTLSIIKPNAVRDNNIGAIISKLEMAGLRVVASKMVFLTEKQAASFYEMHSDKPFFPELIAYMTSGPSIVQVLSGEHAISVNRKVMGATNPKEAVAGTIRAEFAASITENAVHGSDAPESAESEIAFFFPKIEIY